jgi:hypothetical protein
LVVEGARFHGSTGEVTERFICLSHDRVVHFRNAVNILHGRNWLLDEFFQRTSLGTSVSRDALSFLELDQADASVNSSPVGMMLIQYLMGKDHRTGPVVEM